MHFSAKQERLSYIEPVTIVPRLISGVAGIQMIGTSCLGLVLYAEDIGADPACRELHIVDKQIWDIGQFLEARAAIARFMRDQSLTGH